VEYRGFYHDVPPELTAEALKRTRGQSDTPGNDRGRSMSGPRFPRDSCCVATTVSSPPTGCARWSRSASGSPRMRSRLGTASP
jgi:hypothetical protein